MKVEVWEQVQEQCPDVHKVDLLVGLPTFNQASTIESVMHTILAGLRASSAHASVLVVNADVGSKDATPEIVKRTVGSVLPIQSPNVCRQGPVS